MFAIWYHIRQAIRDACNDNTNPLTIHLNEDLAPEWLDSKDTRKLITEFRDLGFTPGTPYVVPEMSGMSILSLFHDKYLGVVYDHPQTGRFFDLLHRDDAGNYLTVTTAPLGADLDPLPGFEKIFLKEISVQQAFDAIDERCGSLVAHVHSDTDFRETVETYYKKETAYRNNKGGVSYDEFRKLAESSGKSVAPKELQEAYLALKQEELYQWNWAGTEEYFKQNSIPEEEQYGDACFFIVPQNADPSAFVHYLCNYDIVDDNHVEKLAKAVAEESSITDLFTRINAARSPEIQAERCGEVTFPVNATVFKIAA